MATDNRTPDADAAPAWQPIARVPRRVLGVLVEKAKTTPDAYPLTLNALTNGCNQKSNRDPVMNLSPDDVEEALDSLREKRAVAEVHGGGRVAKYRHYMKDWLGVDGTELAVVTELLLRGAQSVGDLRGRAARMASGQLPDVHSLRPVVAALIAKKLVIPLTPEGRGQVVTHGLLLEQEMAAMLAKYEGGAPAASHTPDCGSQTIAPTSPAPTSPPSSLPSSTRADSGESSQAEPGGTLSALQAEVRELRLEVARLKKEIEDIWSNLGVSIAREITVQSCLAIITAERDGYFGFETVVSRTMLSFPQISARYMQIHVEFYGIPRQRAATAALTLDFPEETVSLAKIVGALAMRYPQLAAACFTGNSLQQGYTANLNGDQFLTGNETIPDQATVLILSADAGG